jgi:hypothetical protein
MNSETKKLPDAIVHLFSDSSGIYIPKRFADECAELWQHVESEDVARLKQGPDVEGYWETWIDVMNQATFSRDGYVWTLHQDGDLWAVCHDLMTDEECDNFGFDYPSASGETLEYYIDQNVIVALMIALENDDFSGMDYATQKLVEQFDKDVLSGNSVDIRTRPAEFRECDVTGLMCECLTVWVTPTKGSQA